MNSGVAWNDVAALLFSAGALFVSIIALLRGKKQFRATFVPFISGDLKLKQDKVLWPGVPPASPPAPSELEDCVVSISIRNGHPNFAIEKLRWKAYISNPFALQELTSPDDHAIRKAKESSIHRKLQEPLDPSKSFAILGDCGEESDEAWLPLSGDEDWDNTGVSYLSKDKEKQDISDSSWGISRSCLREFPTLFHTDAQGNVIINQYHSFRIRVVLHFKPTVAGVGDMVKPWESTIHPVSKELRRRGPGQLGRPFKLDSWVMERWWMT